MQPAASDATACVCGCVCVWGGWVFVCVCVVCVCVPRVRTHLTRTWAVSSSPTHKSRCNLKNKCLKRLLLIP